MENEQAMNPEVQSRQIIRRGIRECLTSKNSNPERAVTIKGPYFKPIDDLYTAFVDNFRNAGGIYMPCNNIPGDQGNLVHTLTAIIKGLRYNYILNTCNQFSGFLTKYGIRYQSAINVNEPAEVAIVYSDMLIARNGSIGILQENAEYTSIRNLSSDIIVISFLPCIYMDRSDAMEAYRKQHGDALPPMVEYITPTKLENPNSKSAGKPTEPRIFLLMLEEDLFNGAQTQQKNTANESQNQESAN